jgi:hypothetical protein
MLLHTGNQEVSSQQFVALRNICKFDSMHVLLYITKRERINMNILILKFTQVHTSTYYDDLLVYIRALDIEINILEEALDTAHEFITILQNK